LPTYYKLIKTLENGVSYRAETDKFYVIDTVCSNTVNSIGYLEVAGARCLEIHSDVSPLAMTAYNWIDPLPLGDLYVVVPPAKVFRFVGDSGSKLYIMGRIGEMLTPADFPASESARLGEQAKRFLRVQRGSVQLASAGGSWPDGDERNVLTVTATAGERHIFDSRLTVSLSGLASVHNAGDIALRLYYQDKPLDILDSGMGDLGLDVWQAFWNDGTNYYRYYIDLSDMPIQLEPGRTLKVNVRNVKGSAISASSTSALTCTVSLVDEYLMLP
jgi:hypothetical protein